MTTPALLCVLEGQAGDREATQQVLSATPRKDSPKLAFREQGNVFAV
jgi:hypothetical protein